LLITETTVNKIANYSSTQNVALSPALSTTPSHAYFLVLILPVRLLVWVSTRRKISLQICYPEWWIDKVWWALTKNELWTGLSGWTYNYEKMSCAATFQRASVIEDKSQLNNSFTAPLVAKRRRPFRTRIHYIWST